MINELNEFWASSLNGCKPEAHNLKHLFQNRWVRYHTLVGSKRYPETDMEYKEVLIRHHVVLDELRGLSNKFIIILTKYSEAKEPGKLKGNLSKLFPFTKYWCSISRNEDGDELSYWHLFACEILYSGSELDELLTLVMNDEVRNIMVVAEDMHAVFHPYDGGADIIFYTHNQGDAFKHLHATWLSTQANGY